VPTERGYRTFVDQLMQPLLLSSPERQLLIDQLQGLSVQPDMLMRECSRLLGRLSNLLGVVLSPKLATGVLDRLEVVPLSSSRMIFVLSLRGGLVKTVVLELDSVLDRNALDQVVVILNERLAGLTMEEIRQTYAQRIDDIKDEHTGLVKLVLKSSSSLFSEQIDGRLSMAGAQNIVIQPEFVEQPDQVKTLVELLEDENFIVQLLEEKAGMKTGRASAWIGSEMSEEKVDKYALVTAQYQFGETIGTVGVIGPKRMNYARVFALVEGIAVLMSRVDPVRH
jgi:heat-inducible transcriptional repressor